MLKYTLTSSSKSGFLDMLFPLWESNIKIGSLQVYFAFFVLRGLRNMKAIS